MTLAKGATYAEQLKFERELKKLEDGLRRDKNKPVSPTEQS